MGLMTAVIRIIAPIFIVFPIACSFGFQSADA